MLSNRTANFKINEGAENIEKNNNENILVKQFTSPLPKFDIHFKFQKEEEKEDSSFSFKNDLLDKKAYEFIKSKDACLTEMNLDDSIQNEESNIKDNISKVKEKLK